MSIFRNVVLNLKTEQECDRAIGLYKEQLSSLTGEGIENVYICRLSKDSVLFFVTIDNETNAKRIFETMLAWREKQNLDLIDSLVLDGEIEKFLTIVISGIMILDLIKIVLYQSFLLIFLIEFS